MHHILKYELLISTNISDLEKCNDRRRGLSLRELSLSTSAASNTICSSRLFFGENLGIVGGARHSIKHNSGVARGLSQVMFTFRYNCES